MIQCFTGFCINELLVGERVVQSAAFFLPSSCFNPGEMIQNFFVNLISTGVKAGVVTHFTGQVKEFYKFFLVPFSSHEQDRARQSKIPCERTYIKLMCKFRSVTSVPHPRRVTTFALYIAPGNRKTYADFSRHLLHHDFYFTAFHFHKDRRSLTRVAPAY